MSRKTYTAEFKTEALRMMADQSLALAEVARCLGDSEGGLRAWRDAACQHGEAAFHGRGRPSPADEGLVRLRAERDLLT